MKDFQTVFAYNFKKQIKSKSFIMSTIIIILLSYILFFVLNTGLFTEKIVNIGVIDRTGYFKDDLDVFNENMNNYSFSLKEDMADSDIKQVVMDKNESYIIFDFNADKEVKLTMICNEDIDNTGYSKSVEIANKIYGKVLADQISLTDEQYNIITQDIISEVVQADTTHNNTFIVTYLCIFVLAISIMMHGGNVSNEIAYCKTNRVMDLLITSVSSKTVFLGVTISTGAVGLVQLLFIIGNAFLGYKLIHPEMVVIDSLVIDFSIISADKIVVYLSLFLLGYLLYAFLYAGISSIINKPEDVSSATLPITLLASLEMIVALYALSSPKSMLTILCSYLPFTSSTTMFVRYITGNAKIGSVITTMGILIISICIVTIITSKMFRFGSTYYGNLIKGRKLRLILKK